MPINTYVFDAYGTLFDVHSAVRRLSERLGPNHTAFSDLWRQKQLEYTWVRTLAGRYRDFRTVTEDALDYCLSRFPDVDAGLKPALMNAYLTLDAFAEVEPVLERLRLSGARLAILSNGTRAMLDEAISHTGLEGLFDAVISVDGLKRFKTVPDTYRLVTELFEITPDKVSFQSSNAWDIAGATAFGFRTVWINRAGLPPEYPDLAPTHSLTSLEGLERL